jgi:hypothetical protein
MESFEESGAGRLLTLAIAVPLIVGACVKLHGGDLDALAITVGLFGAIVLATFGCAMALNERPRYAIVAIISFPPTLLLYFPLLGMADELPILRLAMAVASLGLLGFLAKGALPRAKAHAVPRLRRIVYHA